MLGVHIQREVDGKVDEDWPDQIQLVSAPPFWARDNIQR